MNSKIPFDPQKLRARCLARTAGLLAGRSSFGPAATDKSWITNSDYTFIDNHSNILAVGHCDFVEHVPTFSRASLVGERVYFSPAMDDRLGVYTILDVLPQLGLTYDVLLTDNEEKGLSTAESFIPPDGKQYNWIFEFDRRGTGAVFYQYDHTAISDAAKDYFKHEIGTFSDISLLDLKCGGINVGTGYYHEHNYYCHMILSDWEDQVQRFIRFYRRYKDTRFPYAGGSRRYSRYSYGGGSTYYPSRGYDDDYHYRPGHWDKALNKWVYDDIQDETITQVKPQEEIPQVVKDWLATQPYPPPVLGTYDEMWDWAASVPMAVKSYIDSHYLTDKSGDIFKPRYVSKWLEKHVQPPAAIVPFASEEPNQDPVMDADEWEHYAADREKYRIDPNIIEFCDFCGTANAEFLLPNGSYTCGGCDDLLWWTDRYHK
jgi:hypothetical protein